MTAAANPTQPQRCYLCFRPQAACFCHAIPKIDNSTPIVILQHRRERFHPFNSARIVRHALSRCQWITGYNHEIRDQFEAMRLDDRAGVLYPSADAAVLSQLAPSQQPSQLVVIDGTWHQAKTLYRDIPRLRGLPCFRLNPETPGQFQIRREPDQQSLSTLEAVTESLSAIAPDPNLSKLTDAFLQMISDQLANRSSNWRKNEKRRVGSPNIPRVLSGDPSHLVIAYGEQEQGYRDKGSSRRSSSRRASSCRASSGRAERPKPVCWKALRLGSGERFDCVVESPSLANADFLEYLRLDPAAVRLAVSIDQFIATWRDFMRPGDHLVVHRPGTAKLLENVGAAAERLVVLKSIAMDFSGVTPSPEAGLTSRAEERLKLAVAMVEQIRGENLS